MFNWYLYDLVWLEVIYLSRFDSNHIFCINYNLYSLVITIPSIITFESILSRHSLNYLDQSSYCVLESLCCIKHQMQNLAKDCMHVSNQSFQATLVQFFRHSFHVSIQSTQGFIKFCFLHEFIHIVKILT